MYIFRQTQGCLTAYKSYWMGGLGYPDKFRSTTVSTTFNDCFIEERIGA